MNRTQEVGFKEREVGLQTDEVRRCMDSMREQGVYGAGMSSFGPAVYAVAEELGGVRKVVAEFEDSTIGWQVFVSGGSIGEESWTPDCIAKSGASRRMLRV